jgi:hypothetical protein
MNKCNIYLISKNYNISKYILLVFLLIINHISLIKASATIQQPIQIPSIQDPVQSIMQNIENIKINNPGVENSDYWKKNIDPYLQQLITEKNPHRLNAFIETIKNNLQFVGQTKQNRSVAQSQSASYQTTNKNNTKSSNVKKQSIQTSNKRNNAKKVKINKKS